MKPELCRYCLEALEDVPLIQCEVPEYWERRLKACSLRTGETRIRAIHYTPALEAWVVRRRMGRVR